jgi:small basic protein (TIGR04137 family)
MSIHKSLKLKAALKRARNVYTRWERVQILSEKGVFDEGDSVYRLPKVKVTVLKKGGKKKKDKKKEAAK